MEFTRFLNWIDSIPEYYHSKLAIQIKDETIQYTDDNNNYEILRSEIEAIPLLDDQHPHDLFYDEHTYEVPITTTSLGRTPHLSYLRNHNRYAQFEDTENGFTYSLSKPSLTFVLNYVFRAPPSELHYHLRHRLYDNRPISYDSLDESEEVKVSTIERLFHLMLRITVRRTLKIESREQLISIEKFENLANAFSFNFSYNFNATIQFRRSENHDKDHLISKLFKNNSSTDELDPPKRIYNAELLAKYNMAVSSDNPFVMYLGFYHVIEFFFESVFKEDLITQLRNEITHPKFSTKRNSDMQKIIDLIKKRVKSNLNDFQGTEEEALKLTLSKYLELDNLKTFLSSNNNLDEYYQNNDVSFSSGTKFAIMNDPDDKIIRNISSRIYKTRNALVHSKSNDFLQTPRGVYHPLKHEKALIMEIPLLKFIAENLIIKHSQPV
ncbi:hypothetical protein [Pleomorphochaeta sp. DL1XJH-081]|uniref:hypothetical protein n=1 Tax=Pleomorphochaeta sp. DL1XJH-081 TaxID=3409690 RepID=UPI003BB60E38